ncbi:MAG: CocE/NonD family hydrolase, partial [Abditibacteriaceae bacterium]
NDGLDTLDWLACQTWCNGRVGMYGDSYMGAVQFAVAPYNHPVLKAINPRFIPGDTWQYAYYRDGVYCLGLNFSWLILNVNSPQPEEYLLPFYDVPAALRQLPLGTLEEKMGCRPSPAFRNLLKHTTPDEHYDAWRWQDSLKETTVPTLITGGWYDYYAGSAFLDFAALQSAPNAQVAASHRLIVGPWTHGLRYSSQLGEFDFGSNATQEDDHNIRWLDCLLKGGSSEDFQKAPIRIFVMGENIWRDDWEWPLARTKWTPFYLRDGGVLSSQIPQNEETDEYVYDPENPVPTTGGNHSVGDWTPGLYEICQVGPYEQSRVETRDDVLVYTGEVLECDVEVTGPIIVTLFAASSAPDTDWVARLCDVYPDGKSFNITEGVIRAAFQKRDWNHPQPIEPGRIYEYTINLHATSNVFKKGHRIRLQITSSNFPLWARNLNTGEPYATGTQMQVAHQTIYHDTAHPSHIILPLIPQV